MTLLESEIRREAEALGVWYHSIKLTGDYAPPSRMAESQATVWQATRNIRAGINYSGRSVLDLGSLEGMWAFEAEQLGAKIIVASDKFQMCGSEMFDRFCLARFCRQSKVFYVTNADVHCLQSRVASVMRLFDLADKGFDIIQCTGLLYHVQHPLLALQEIRRCSHVGSSLLLETACSNGSDSVAAFNLDGRIYGDPVTYWVPTMRCLMDMLRLSGFAVRESTVVNARTDRVSLVADAVEFEDRERILG
jgi:tRNA (mo5U34)-methyltransferase